MSAEGEAATTPVPPRALVVGGSGMLGSDVADRLRDEGWAVTAPDRADLDICDALHLESLRKRTLGDFAVVVNCAGYTQVDRAESEVMAAMNLNGVAPGALAAVCRENGWRLLHVSTDFVFDGETDRPYVEDDLTRPLNVYGKSKLLGERNALREDPATWVVRTSWLYGANGKCFPKTIIAAWKDGKDLRVVTDQSGTPTYTVDLAATITEFLRLSPPGGVYHAAGPDVTTWHGFAVATLESANALLPEPRPVVATPVTSADWPTAAKRPAYSALSTAKVQALGIVPMRPLAEALAAFVRLVG